VFVFLSFVSVLMRGLSKVNVVVGNFDFNGFCNFKGNIFAVGFEGTKIRYSTAIVSDSQSTASTAAPK